MDSDGMNANGINAMEQVYKKYAQTVYGFLLSKTKDVHLAEELTQETFFRAIKSSKNYRGEGNVSTWLCGIAKNVFLEHLRKKKKWESLEAMEEAQASEATAVASAEEEVFGQWDQVEILKALHKLKDPMREVMYLRLSGNLSFAQIGEIMDKSENWARVTFYRGKEKLLKEVNL